MTRSESIKEISNALCKAQGAFRVAEFDCVNPHFKSKYASLTSVMNVVREPLTNNGLSFVQVVLEEQNTLNLETTLFHVSGEWISARMPLYLSKEDMQGLGSAITYAKRYSISAMLGVVSDEDDDGNAARETTNGNKNQRPDPPAPRPGAKTTPVPKPEPKEHVLEVSPEQAIEMELTSELRKTLFRCGWSHGDAVQYRSEVLKKPPGPDSPLLTIKELEQFKNHVLLHPKGEAPFEDDVHE